MTQNQHPSFVEGQILPDRVTFQNICQTKSTPFDRYKFKVAATRQEGNSVTRAAKHLGISDQAFEESLKDEINELLNEIEATLRGYFTPHIRTLSVIAKELMVVKLVIRTPSCVR